MSEKRDQYVEALKTKLDEWNREIDALSTKADEVKADLGEKYREEVAELRRKWAAADEKLDELRRSGGDAWEDMKDGAEEVWDTLGRSVRSMISRFR